MTKEEIENKAVAICGILRGTNLDEIAFILGAIFYGIISSTEEIDETKAKAFAELVKDRIDLAIEADITLKTPKTQKPCSKK